VEKVFKGPEAMWAQLGSLDTGGSKAARVFKESKAVRVFEALKDILGQ